MAEECLPLVAEMSTLARKDKRKDIKKKKRKLLRKQNALQEKEEEDARLNDPDEQARIRLKEQEEAAILEEQRREHEEREKAWLEAAARRKAEEEERKRNIEESWRNESREESENDDEEYVEDGPAEIIWKGDKIFVRKRKVKASEKRTNQLTGSEFDDMPASNPLPPQSEAFAAFNHVTSDQIMEVFAQQTPNFGTEQDKSHCPFHFKTGACRFGSRCSRVHFYPDKSCTILVKNMYSGPGLAWEHDEGLEHTDEEVDHGYEQFYEDVHTEFLKYGEIVNFKVCRNGSSHLRGNVYIHYKFLDSAIFAFNSTNGRFFASKQISCEYVGVTKWRIAICGEYLKSKSKNCSRGSTCNFLHCFRNPGGDYEWADWDKPPPKYWMRKMASLFGPSDETRHNLHEEAENHVKENSRGDAEVHSRRSYSRRSSYDDRKRGEKKAMRKKSRSGKNSPSLVGNSLEECGQYERDDSDDRHCSGKRRYQRRSCSEESHGEDRRRKRCIKSQSRNYDEGEPCVALNIVGHHSTGKKECHSCVSDEELPEGMERRTSSKRSQSRVTSSPEISRCYDIPVYDVPVSKRKSGKNPSISDNDNGRNHKHLIWNHDEEESEYLDETSCDSKEEKHRNSKKPVKSKCDGRCDMHEVNECQICGSRKEKIWERKSPYDHSSNNDMRDGAGPKIKEDLEGVGYIERQRRSRKLENEHREHYRSRSGNDSHTRRKENEIRISTVAPFGIEISNNFSINDRVRELDNAYPGLEKFNKESVDCSTQEFQDRKLSNSKHKRRRKDHESSGKDVRYSGETKYKSHRSTTEERHRSRPIESSSF